MPLMPRIINSYLDAFAFELVTLHGSSVSTVRSEIGATPFPMLLLGGVKGWLLGKTSIFKKWKLMVGGAPLAVLRLSTLADARSFS